MFVGSFPQKILITGACFEHELTIKVAIIGLCEHHTSFAGNACKLCTRVCASYERTLRVKTCKRQACTSGEKRGVAQHECRVFPSNLLFMYIHVHTCTYMYIYVHVDGKMQPQGYARGLGFLQSSPTRTMLDPISSMQLYLIFYTEASFIAKLLSSVKHTRTCTYPIF